MTTNQAPGKFSLNPDLERKKNFNFTTNKQRRQERRRRQPHPLRQDRRQGDPGRRHLRGRKVPGLPRHLPAGPRPLSGDPEVARRAQQALEGVDPGAQGDAGPPALRGAAGRERAGAGRGRLPRRRQRRGERVAVGLPPAPARPGGEADDVAARVKKLFLFFWFLLRSFFSRSISFCERERDWSQKREE